jgi:hypothetical protein
MADDDWTMKCEVFRVGSFTTWERAFADAAEFATKVGRDNVVNVSHSADGSVGVIAVWYWSVED